MSLEEKIEKLTAAVDMLTGVLREHVKVLSQRTGINGHGAPAADPEPEKPKAPAGKRETAAAKKKREAEEAAAAAAAAALDDDDGLGDPSDDGLGDDLLGDDLDGDGLDDGLGDGLDDDGLGDDPAPPAKKKGERTYTGMEATQVMKALRDVLFKHVGPEVGKTVLKKMLVDCGVTNIQQVTDADATIAVAHVRRHAHQNTVLKEWMAECKTKFNVVVV